MGAYIVRRTLWAILLLLVVSFLTFVIFNVFPSADPAALRAGRNATPALVHQIRINLGLNKPFYTQFWIYLKGLVEHFNLGYSYYNSESVKSEIFSRMPATISVTVGGFIVWMLIGLPVGIVSAIRPRSILDRVMMGTSLVAISAPVYFLGLVSLFLFAKGTGQLQWFGAAGSYVPITQNVGVWFNSLILPWFTLAAAFAAFYARMTRGNLIETMHEDYIRTARAKGLRESVVITKHGLRAALTPIVTMAGMDIGLLLGGAILTEIVFNIPGIGRYAYDAIVNSDLPAIQGTVLFGAFFIVFANLVVDILYAFLDPRVTYG
ncbi:MAG TPA: ABC transporter permease [Gaiellaceae bacterium]|nr:ABC transporter permease [Gaiellaceae bacterium]